jgi:hypothetical protein
VNVSASKGAYMNIEIFYQVFFRIFRTKRMEQFDKAFSPDKQTKILDVGGTPYNWLISNCSSQITLLNLSAPEDINDSPKNISFIVGDGTNLEYRESEFDICFSNSVIEHLGTFENQMLFAQEIRRVGKKIWVQTPARAFFFEPHWLAPFIHYFPVRTQRKLARYFTLRGWLLRPNQDYIDNLLAELRLLTYKEMKQLFPDCEIRVERFLGMEKAYIAIRQ